MNTLDKAWNAWMATMVILLVFALGEGSLLIPKETWAAALAANSVDANGYQTTVPTD